MKKKILFLNFTLIVAVLFSMLFQSLDSFGHFETQKAELKCHHKNASKHEITHQHHTFENCLICKLSFSAAVSSKVFFFEIRKSLFKKTLDFSVFNIFPTFYKNSNPHRGPPFFNV